MTYPDPKKSEDCACQQNGDHGKPERFTCDDKPFPFTDEELFILAELRALKSEAMELKAHLAEIHKREAQGESLLDERAMQMKKLMTLRREWDDWKQKGADAAKRRMIALGHVEASEGYVPDSCGGCCPIDPLSQIPL